MSTRVYAKKRQTVETYHEEAIITRWHEKCDIIKLSNLNSLIINFRTNYKIITV